MKIMVEVLSNLNIASLLFILFLSILGLYGIMKKLRNERTKRVECVDIIDIKRLKVKNRFAYLIPISFWKKHIASDKVIKYMEHEREIVIAGVISNEEIENARDKNKIYKFLKEEVKGKNLRISYRFKKKVDSFFWKRIFEIIKSKENVFTKIKNFFKIWFIKYNYYFDIIYLNKEKRKSILTNDMIVKFKLYTKNESIVQMFRYRKAVNQVKFHRNSDEKTDVENNVALNPVWESEILNENLED